MLVTSTYYNFASNLLIEIFTIGKITARYSSKRQKWMFRELLNV